MSHLKGLSQNINHGNLWTIECQQPNNALRTGLSITFDCHCAVDNCRSVGNKINDIKHEIYNHNLDFCALTETWIKEDENTIPNCLCPSGYNIISIPHISSSGGGIALVYRSNLDVKINSSYTFEAIECVDFSLNLDRYNILLAVNYRPPDSSVLQFANELAAYMEKISAQLESKSLLVISIYISTNRMKEMPLYLVICLNPSIYQTMLNSQPINCKTHRILSSTNKTQSISEMYIKDTFFLIIIWSYLILHLKAKFHSPESRPLGNINPSIWKISRMMRSRN